MQQLSGRALAGRPCAQRLPNRRVAPGPRRAVVPRTAASPSAGGSSLGGLSILQNTRPVDRLRFQAMLVFKHFDEDGNGRLSPAQLDAYVAYSAERLGPAAAALGPAYEAARAAGGAAGLDMEAFIDLVREQVKAASASREFPRSVFSEAELGKLGWDASLPPAELSSVLAVFRLLDFNADNYVKLEDLRKAQGIEREIVADQLEDADTNEDGFLSFADFLKSYARDKPVILNMLVLLAHTAAYWFVLNLPMLELPIKACLCAFMLFKPQIITTNVIKLYQIGRTVVDRARAEIEMAQMRGRQA